LVRVWFGLGFSVRFRVGVTVSVRVHVGFSSKDLGEEGALVSRSIFTEDLLCARDCCHSGVRKLAQRRRQQ